MRVVFCLFTVLLGSAACLQDTSADIADFDQTWRGYEFIFHDDHDLLLIVHGNVCYFVRLPDENEWHLWSDDDKRRAEDYLISQIEKGRSEPSDLQTLRNTFNDVLADYRCSGKQISELTPEDPMDSWILHLVDTVVDTAGGLLSALLGLIG